MFNNIFIYKDNDFMFLNAFLFFIFHSKKKQHVHFIVYVLFKNRFKNIEQKKNHKK